LWPGAARFPAGRAAGGELDPTRPGRCSAGHLRRGPSPAAGGWSRTAAPLRRAASVEPTSSASGDVSWQAVAAAGCGRRARAAGGSDSRDAATAPAGRPTTARPQVAQSAVVPAVESAAASVLPLCARRT
jgi:hypothetical protein